jgi:cation:H+ antiporter
MLLDVVLFLICAGFIAFSGTALSKQGNRLAEITGLSKAWIGLILMAAITSLPELVTGISAIAVVRAPDLAVGNVFGSCAFNLLILSLLDLFLQKPLTSLVRTSHLIAVAFSIILLAVAGVGMSFHTEFQSILWISPVSIVIVIVYGMSVRSIFLFERSQNDVPTVDVPVSTIAEPTGTIKKVILLYLGHASIVVAAALFLPYLGENIANHFQLGDSFVGTVLLAITTSLPEIAVSIAALRLGSVDMAMGNLLGSNVFNVAILSLFDFFHTEGPVYASVSSGHLLSIFSSIVMTAIVAIGLVVRPNKKLWRLSIDGWIVLSIYLLTVFILR